MLVAALLAMVLAAAAPAFAQTAVGGDTAVLQYSCNEIQAALNVQYQQGEGTGAVAGAAQSLGVDQNAVLACFGTAVAAQQSTINVNTADGGGGAKKVTTVTAKAGGGATATASPTASATATASAPAALPETGGASAIALGAAVLLVAGGLLARRIVR